MTLGSAGAATSRSTSPAARADVDTAITDPTFTRYNVDTAATGAALHHGRHGLRGRARHPDERRGAPFDGSRPVGPGSLNIYRPGATLADWTKVTVFGPEAGIIMPNATTVTDVDGDGDNDIIVPSGHFFGTDPGVAAELRTLSGSITWWENNGPAPTFVRHDVITGQAGVLPRRPVRRLRRRRHQGHPQRQRGGGAPGMPDRRRPRDPVLPRQRRPHLRGAGRAGRRRRQPAGRRRRRRGRRPGHHHRRATSTRSVVQQAVSSRPRRSSGSRTATRTAYSRRRTSRFTPSPRCRTSARLPDPAGRRLPGARQGLVDRHQPRQPVHVRDPVPGVLRP